MGMVLAFIVGAIVGITLMCIAVTLEDDERNGKQ